MRFPLAKPQLGVDVETGGNGRGVNEEEGVSTRAVVPFEKM